MCSLNLDLFHLHFFPVLSKVKTLSALRCLVFKVFDTSDKLEIKANQY